MREFSRAKGQDRPLTLPWKGRAYGRNRIKKGFKQIRLEIFSLFLLKPASARKGAANAAERSAVNIKIPGGNSISSAEGWFACFPFAKQISGVDLPKWGREYGRGWGTKGQKQIRFETFSLFLLRPASARKDVTE